MKDKEVILKAENITKYYGREQVLDIEEFELYEGVLNFLLGANGSGKTTLLKILSLVDKDYTGQLSYYGQLLDKQESALLDIRRNFSVIWQEPYLYNKSVFDNIGLPLKLRKVQRSKIEKRIEELADQLQISHLLEKNSRELSGGEKQKVSIARALITDPEILFIDEPNTNLDYKSSQFFNELFAKLVADGMTILLITHDLYQIKNLADYITILKQGKVVISDQKDKVLANGKLKNNNILDQKIVFA